MNRLREHLGRAIGSLLLLESLQVALTAVALAYAYKGQILPPYGFFPSQLYDFVAKLRWAARGWLEWLPALPDSFLPTPTTVHLGTLTALLPACLATALLLGVAAGLLGAMLPWKRFGGVRSYLVFWLVVGLVVHAVAALPALSLEDHPTWSHVIYRSRSLIIDGLALAMVVFAVANVLAHMVVGAFSRHAVLTAGSSAFVLGASLFFGDTGAAPTAGGAPLPTPVAGAPAGEPINIVLISLDSLRADHVGCYGYERDTTPTLDRFAGEGVRFANANSTSSWTLPTHLTMFTSRYQLSHGVVHETYTLNPAVPTAGEIFKAAGYITGGFVSAPYVAAHYGYARGMDVYEDLSAAYKHRSEARSAIVAPEVNAMALPWLEANKDRPFFLFLHYFDIHYDFIPPPPYDTMFDPHYEGEIDGRDFIERSDVNPEMHERDLEHIIALYDGEIRFTDKYVGEILDRIDALGLRERTLVIIVSDHGDEFFEHENKGHHRTLYEEVLRVPLLVRLPDGSHAGSVVEEQVTLVDLLPTMVDVAGLESPGGFEGISLLSLIDGSALGRREAIYSAFFDKRGFNLQAARLTIDAKTIQHFNRITHPKRRPVEYYELPADAAEQQDRAMEGLPAMYGELDALAAFLDDQWKINQRQETLVAGANRIELDDETMERLKSLGYVGD